MASEVDICNLALANIGAEANVAAIDPPDGTIEAYHCARFYPIARNAMLEAFPWSFATVRKALTENAETSEQWEYVYTLPNPCLRPLAVLWPDSPDDSEPQPYTLETNTDGDLLLLTNVEDAVLKYTTLVTDSSRFTPTFVVALSWLVAHFIAVNRGRWHSAQKRVVNNGDHERIRDNT